MVKLMRQTDNEVRAERDRLKSINADLLAALKLLRKVAVPYMSQAIMARNPEACHATAIDLSVAKADAAIARARSE